MIDKKTRDQGLSPGMHGGRPCPLEVDTQQPKANVLIWVEGDAELARASSARRGRGLIVVAHGNGQGATEGSFVIAYPIAIDDHSQSLPAVSGLLKTMGWSVLAFRRGRTDGGDVNTAVLISTAHFGPEQRLWLAEPIRQAHDRNAPAHAPMPVPSFAPGRGDTYTREFRNQLEAWLNEGGAGDDVA